MSLCLDNDDKEQDIYVESRDIKASKIEMCDSEMIFLLSVIFLIDA